MATLGEIRAALKSTLKTYIAGLHVYDTVADAVNYPAAVVMPSSTLDNKTVVFGKSMARGLDEWHINCYILVPRGTDAQASQKQLDQYLSSSGPKSVRTVLWEHADLGLTDGTDCTLESASGYGGRFDTDNTSSVGVCFHTTIITPGR